MQDYANCRSRSLQKGDKNRSMCISPKNCVHQIRSEALQGVTTCGFEVSKVQVACKSCGYSSPDNAVTCSYCGQPIK